MRADLDFTADGFVTAQFGDRARGNRFGDQPVGVHRVDADPVSFDLNDLPRVSKLAAFVRTK